MSQLKMKLIAYTILFLGIFSAPLYADNVLLAQELLTKLGYAPGPIDGSYGKKTKYALENYYTAQNQQFDGQLSANEIIALKKSVKNPNFSYEALEMMDEYVQQSELLKVPMPKSNLVIKDYKRFRDYRVNHYKNNYSFTKWLWKEKGSRGQILDKKYCYETLAKFLMPTNSNSSYKGRTERDFTRCQNAFLTYGVTSFDASFKMYQKLFLEMAESKKDHWVYRHSANYDFNPSYYHLGGVISTFYMYYAVNYEVFSYTKKERTLIESYFKKKAFSEYFKLDGDRKTALCPIENPMRLNKRFHKVNNCGSVRLRFAAGELALAIVTQDRALWQKGLWDLDFSLSMINDEGFFVPLSAKGCKALGYTFDTSRLFSLNLEMLKLANFNLLHYQSRHGKTISQAYEMLFKQYEDITISNHIAKKGIGSNSCGSKPFKTHNEFVVQEFGSVDDRWVPELGRYINWSIRYVSEQKPEWIKKNTLRDIKTDPFIGNYHTITAFEIYNANIMSEPKNIWKEKRNKEKAKRKIKQELLLSYDGNYHVYLSLKRDGINKKINQELGSIKFVLNSGKAKFDKSNILYDALGLEGVSVSLGYDGSVTINGFISDETGRNKQCVYLLGNLNSEKNFKTKSYYNCVKKGQRLQVKFIKISDDINWK